MTKNQRAELMKLADEIEKRGDNIDASTSTTRAFEQSAYELRKLVGTFDDDDEAANLLRSATMLEEYAPELFGPPENGQEHFGHAMMIGVAESIRDYLGEPKEPSTEQADEEPELSPEESAAAVERLKNEYILRSNLYTRPIPRMEELFGNGTRDALAWLFFEALTIISTHPAYSHMTPEECYYDLLKKVAERITKSAVTAAGGEVVVAAFPDPSKVPDIVKTGFAGVLPTGQIVDRRMYGDAIPIPGNTSLGIPGPLPVSVPECGKSITVEKPENAEA